MATALQSKAIRRTAAEDKEDEVRDTTAATRILTHGSLSQSLAGGAINGTFGSSAKTYANQQGFSDALNWTGNALAWATSAQKSKLLSIINDSSSARATEKTKVDAAVETAVLNNKTAEREKVQSSTLKTKVAKRGSKISSSKAMENVRNTDKKLRGSISTTKKDAKRRQNAARLSGSFATLFKDELGA